MMGYGSANWVQLDTEMDNSSRKGRTHCLSCMTKGSTMAKVNLLRLADFDGPETSRSKRANKKGLPSLEGLVGTEGLEPPTCCL